MGEQPTAFFSYARWDDEHDGGYLSQFRKRLADEVQAQMGSEVLIFQDQIDVAWGQDWQQRITDSLNETVLFIPIFTPTFFSRPACRQEASLFLEREKAQGSRGLILPVYYISSPPLEDEAERAKDPLAQALKAVEVCPSADWRKLRGLSFRNGKVRVALVSLAGELCKALKRVASPAPIKIITPETPAVQAEPIIVVPRISIAPKAVEQTILPPADNGQVLSPPLGADAHEDIGLFPGRQEPGPAPPTAHGIADSLINLGIALGQTGDLMGATDRFREAITLDPGDVDCLVGIGVALVQMGDMPGAFHQFDQAVAVAPNSAPAHNGLGMVLGQMGNLPGAAGQFSQAIAVDPAFGSGYNNLGIALVQMGDLNGAVQQFRRAAALPARDADALISIGVALVQMGDMPGAFHQFDQAVALDPTSATALNSLGMALWQAGDVNGAAGQFQKAVALEPGFSKARNNLAMTLAQMGNLNGAMEQFRQVIADETNGQNVTVTP